MRSGTYCPVPARRRGSSVDGMLGACGGAPFPAFAVTPNVVYLYMGMFVSVPIMRQGGPLYMQQCHMRVGMLVGVVALVTGALALQANLGESSSVLIAAQPEPPQVATRGFIVPDDDVVRAAPAVGPDAKPVVPQQQLNGPQSQALAEKVQRLIGPDYRLKGGSDVAIDCGIAVRVGFADASRNFIEVQRQCLTSPAKLSAVAGANAQLTVRPDGTAVAVSPDGPTVRVAKTSPIGELIQVAVWGPPPAQPGKGATAPLSSAQAQELMRQLG